MNIIMKYRLYSPFHIAFKPLQLIIQFLIDSMCPPNQYIIDSLKREQTVTQQTEVPIEDFSRVFARDALVEPTICITRGNLMFLFGKNKDAEILYIFYHPSNWYNGLPRVFQYIPKLDTVTDMSGTQHSLSKHVGQTGMDFIVNTNTNQVKKSDEDILLQIFRLIKQICSLNNIQL